MDYLASKKLAVILIMAITVLAVVGMLVPQEKPGSRDYINWKSGHAGIVPVVEALQLNKVYSSWWMKTVYALLFLNLTACTVAQAKRLVRSRRGSGQVSKYREISTACLGEPAELVVRYFKKKRYNVLRSKDPEGNETVRAEKNYFTRWSMVVFHCGLLLIIAGILVSVLSATDGIIPLMEGQQVTEDKENYVLLNKGLLAGQHSGLPIEMKDILVDVDIKNRKILTTEVLRFGDETLRIDDRNSVASNGFTIYRDEYGYTLEIGFSRNNGASTDLDFPLLPDPSGRVFSNEINLPGTSYNLKAYLFPNAIRNTKNLNQPYDSDGPALLNPVVALTVKNHLDNKNKTAYLKKEDILSFSGDRFTVSGFGYWSSFRFVRDNGVPVIYAGFLISTLGLVFTYFLIRKEFYVKIQNTGTLEIGGWAERYMSLFRDEMDDLIDFLANGGDIR